MTEILTYTVQEVADAFKTTPGHVRELIHKGEIKAVKIGKRYRITKPELDRLLNSPTQNV